MLSREERNHDGLKRLFATGALVLAALTAVYMATPGTVLADSAADQYVEPELPQEPPQTERPPQTESNSGNKSKGQSRQNDRSAGAGGSEEPSGSSSSSSSSAPSGNPDLNTGDPDLNTGSQGGQTDRKESNHKKGDSEGSQAGESDSSDEAEQALIGSGSSGDGGGRALPLIALLLVAVPVLAAGGYMLAKRYGRSRDDPETRARVQNAVSDGKGSSAS